MTGAGKALVLCVDEYENILTGWERLLEEEGYEVATASDWSYALRLFSSQPADVVLLDSQLPGMPGDAVAAQMKRIKPHVPILLVSGDGPLPKERLKRVEAFLPKSEPITVLATIKTLSNKSRGAARPACSVAA